MRSANSLQTERKGINLFTWHDDSYIFMSDPNVQTYNTLGLRNTYAAVILPQIGFSLPMCIFLYVGFMKYIPNELLLEAGAIDGAGNF